MNLEKMDAFFTARLDGYDGHMLAERFYFTELERLKREQGLDMAALYHYDTPLTVAHEIEILKKAGFSKVQILRNWKATYTLPAR